MMESKEAMTVMDQTIKSPLDETIKQSPGSIVTSNEELLNQSIKQPSNNQSINQTISETINPGLERYVFEQVEVELDDDPSIDQLIIQPLPVIDDDQSINQSIYQSINQSDESSVNQSNNQSVNQSDPVEADNLLVDSFLYTVRSLRQSNNQSNNQSDTVKLPSIKQSKKGSIDQSNSQSNNQTINQTFNFMVSLLSRASMTQTLNVFRNEWRDRIDQSNNQSNNQMIEPLSIEPDIHLNAEYKQEIERLQSINQSNNQSINQLLNQNKALQLEKNFHALRHRTINQSNNQLIKEIKKYDSHISLIDPLIDKLNKQIKRKEKQIILMKFENEKLKVNLSRVEEQLNNQTNNQTNNQSNSQSKTQSNGKAKKSPKNDQSNNQPINQTINQGTLIGDRTESLPHSWPLQSTTNPFHQSNNQSNNQTNNQTINQLKGTYACHPQSLTNICYHPTKNILLTCSDDQTYKLWSSPSNNQTNNQKISSPKLILTGSGHTDYLTVAKFHPSGGFLASSGGDATVRLWRLSPPGLQACFRTSGSTNQSNNQTISQSNNQSNDVIWDLDWHWSGDYLACGHQNSGLTVHDVHTQQKKCSFRFDQSNNQTNNQTINQTNNQSINQSINCVSFLPYSGEILAGGSSLGLFDSRQKGLAQIFNVNQSNNQFGPFFGLSINPDGRTFLASGVGGVVEFDFRSKSILGTFFSQSPIFDCQYSPVNSSSFATACEDGIVRIHQSNNQSNKELIGHKGSVNCVQWDPSGKYLYSGGADGSLRVWA